MATSVPVKRIFNRRVLTAALYGSDHFDVEKVLHRSLRLIPAQGLGTTLLAYGRPIWWRTFDLDGDGRRDVVVKFSMRDPRAYADYRDGQYGDAFVEGVIRSPDRQVREFSGYASSTVTAVARDHPAWPPPKEFLP